MSTINNKVILMKSACDRRSANRQTELSTLKICSEQMIDKMAGEAIDDENGSKKH